MLSKASTPKRRKAENSIYALLKDLDESGENEKLYFEIFSHMSDVEFHKMMKNWQSDPRKYHLTLQVNQSKKTDLLDIGHAEKIAKKYGIKLKEHVIFPHRNPDDPDHPYVSAGEVPILVVYVRKLQQMLDKKNQAVGNIERVDPVLGQVTGDSKAASINDTQTTALVTTNQVNAVREFLGPRADNLPAKLKMLTQIENFGTVKYSDLQLQLRNSQSLQTMKAYLHGAFLESDGLVQKKNIVFDEDEE